MKIFILFLLFTIFLFLLIMHSYYRRGIRLTVNFFLFAFLLIFSHGGSCSLGFLNLIDSNRTTIVSSLANTFLILPIFYLSWHIAEEATKYINFFRGRLFPVILLSGIVILLFNYLVEAIGINIMNSYSLINNFYFFTHFLAAFLLINCSKYKYRNWKIFFFLLPLIYLWIIRLFGIGSFFLLVEECVFIVVLLILAFLSSLTFDYSDIKLPHSPKFLCKLVNIIPSVVLIAKLIALLILSRYFF
ncbi:MAG: hypothetical protein ISS47_01675 [Candidatus Omnitrophica bacterium]|nr:hypothetical protein [Candidatus Omnitrophota bacterium]